MAKLQPGDRIAYAAKFLKNTGQQTGPGGSRRGAYVGPDGSPGFARVRWDDTDFAALAAQWGDDYADDVRANGTMIHETAVAKVGSARFACNDL